MGSIGLPIQNRPFTIQHSDVQRGAPPHRSRLARNERIGVQYVSNVLSASRDETDGRRPDSETVGEIDDRGEIGAQEEQKGAPGNRFWTVEMKGNGKHA